MSDASPTPPATVIVQLTDTHIGPPGSRPYGVDTAAQFREVARVVRAMDLEPAAVLLTGDLSDEGEPESYEHLRELVADELDPIGAPVLSIVGNHDHRASFRAAYLGETDPSDDEPYHYVVDLPAVRLVMADSYVAGKVSGRLGARQLAWIDEQLADAGDRRRSPGPCTSRHPPRPTCSTRVDAGEGGATWVPGSRSAPSATARPSSTRTCCR